MLKNNHLDTSYQPGKISEIALIDLRWVVSFDLFVHSAQDGCQNILLLASQTTDPSTTGGRLPEVGICDGKLFVAYEDIEQFSDGTTFPLGKWVSIEIAVANGKFSLKFDGARKYTTKLPSLQTHENVQVYVGFGSNYADADVKNIKISSRAGLFKEDEFTSFWPKMF